MVHIKCTWVSFLHPPIFPCWCEAIPGLQPRTDDQPYVCHAKIYTVLDFSPIVPWPLGVPARSSRWNCGLCLHLFLHLNQHLSHTSSPKEPLVGTQNISQKVKSEWMNVNLSRMHVVHRVSIHPITWDACYSSLEAKVPLFGLPPLFFYQSVDENQSSSSIWCQSSSTS